MVSRPSEPTRRLLFRWRQVPVRRPPPDVTIQGGPDCYQWMLSRGQGNIFTIEGQICGQGISCPSEMTNPVFLLSWEAQNVIVSWPVRSMSTGTGDESRFMVNSAAGVFLSSSR